VNCKVAMTSLLFVANRAKIVAGRKDVVAARMNTEQCQNIRAKESATLSDWIEFEMCPVQVSVLVSRRKNHRLESHGQRHACRFCKKILGTNRRVAPAKINKPSDYSRFILESESSSSARFGSRNK